MAYLSRAKLEFGPIGNTPTYTNLYVWKISKVFEQ